MNEVPKIAKARLASKKPAGPHPDADLLAAFAEQSLVGKERESLLTHLAACSTCREIVSLAAPEQDIAMPVPTGGSFRERSFLGVSLLRWSAVAVCIVIVASVAVMNRARPSEFNTMARNDTNIATPQQDQKEPAAKSTRETDAGKNAVGQSSASNKEQLRNQPLAMPASTPMENKDVALFAKADTKYEQRKDLDSLHGATAVSIPKEIDRAKKPAMTANEVAQQRAGYNTLKQQPGAAATQNQTFHYNGNRDEKSNNSVGGAYNNGNLAAAGNHNGALTDSKIVASGLNSNSANSSFSINAANAPTTALNDSVQAEAKKTRAPSKSETVEVAAKNSFLETTSAQTLGEVLTPQVTNAENTATLRAKSAIAPVTNFRILAGGRMIAHDAASQTWHPVEVAPNFKVRAITEAYGKIWVAGSSNIPVNLRRHDVDQVKPAVNQSDLYVSGDGKTWTRVFGTWTGDIVVLHFVSDAEGEITTSTDETWKTTDSGKTWRKK